VILSPRPTDWGTYLDSGPFASDAFMENVEDLPVQEREP
jgi:virulence-associated protein VagC